MTAKDPIAYMEQEQAEYRENKQPYEEIARNVVSEWKAQFDAMLEMKPSHPPFRTSDGPRG
jgi:hypothetical protein